jgi:hypothetical protein
VNPFSASNPTGFPNEGRGVHKNENGVPEESQHTKDGKLKGMIPDPNPKLHPKK